MSSNILSPSLPVQEGRRAKYRPTYRVYLIGGNFRPKNIFVSSLKMVFFQLRRARTQRSSFELLILTARSQHFFPLLRLLRREAESNATVVQRSVVLLEKSFGLSIHNVTVEIAGLQRSTQGLDSKVRGRRGKLFIS